MSCGFLDPGSRKSLRLTDIAAAQRQLAVNSLAILTP